MMLAAAALALLSPSPQSQPAASKDPSSEALAAAIESFSNESPSRQEELASLIAARIESCRDPSVKELLGLRDRAVKELKVVPRGNVEFYDPKTFAGGEFSRGRAPVRHVADPASESSAEKRGLYRPWDNEPFYAARVTYDFGRNTGIDWGATGPGGDLHNYLHGYVPQSDRLIAWLESRFDFDATIDPLAQHFGHAYCDLNGVAFGDVTLYDAWASGNRLDMPDVDVIPFAQLILKDKSYVSPIPPGVSQTRLYEKITEGFLTFFRYRTWIEAAANVLVNPEVPLREGHEGLRVRLEYMDALEGGDATKIAHHLASSKTRGDFIDEVDAAFHEKPNERSKAARFAAERNATRWTVARCAYAVLRENGLLSSE